MDQIIEFAKQVLSNDAVQGAIALIMPFLLIFASLLLKQVAAKIMAVFTHKDEIDEKAMKATAEMIAEVKAMREEFSKEIAETKEFAATAKEMTKTMVLNSKAAASTKNEILKIDTVPQTAKETVVIVDTKDIPVYVEEEVKVEEVNELDSLLSKL